MANRHRRAVLAFTLATIALSTCPRLLVRAEMSWTLCDDAAHPVVVKDVTLTPDPPVIGTNATFLVQGRSSVPVDAGSVEIDVSLSGVQIFSTSEDLCAKTPCPVAPGDISVTLVEVLPPIAPPGDYALRMLGTDATGNELVCLQVYFQLVLPSTATATGFSQRGASMTQRKVAPGGQAAAAL